jgi:hypothetical protein
MYNLRKETDSLMMLEKSFLSSKFEKNFEFSPLRKMNFCLMKLKFQVAKICFRDQRKYFI